MANPPQKPQQQKQTSGPVHGVPCPYCGFRNDMRPIKVTGMLAKESTFNCDKCGNHFEVVGVAHVEIVSLKKSLRNAELIAKRKRQPPPARQGTTISHAQLQRRR